MSRVVWIIPVVGHGPAGRPVARTLTRLGAQATTIARYVRVRRTMTAAALRRRMAAEHQN